MKKSSQQICVECKKRKRIAEQVNLKPFCRSCFTLLLRQPEIRHKHRVTDPHDICSCGHSAKEHARERDLRSRLWFSYNELDTCTAEGCECDHFSPCLTLREAR